MSKSSSGTASKNPPQLPTKSAWAQGPPKSASASSSRPQSPAPSAVAHQTHSRRPSTLGQAVPIKDGVSINRSNVGAASKASPVTFGSIDDANAPISSSPVSVPPIKSEGVKAFGSVPATPQSTVNGNSPVSTTRPSLASVTASSPSSTTATPAKPKPKMDVRSLFKGSGTPSTTTSTPPSEASSAAKSSPPPVQQQPSNQSPSIPPAQPQYQNFRPQQPQQQNNGSAPPRSPIHPRNNSGQRPSNGPNTPAPPMGSPRLAPHPPHSGGPAAMPPPPQPMQWTGYPQYYYAGMPPEGYMPYGTTWFPMQPQIPPQTPVHPPPGPMSPRNAPHTLQPAPGTPQPVHAVPNSPHPHPAPTHSHSSSVSSAPTASPAGGSGTARLNSGARDFVPGGRPASKIVIRNQDGSEVNFNELRRQNSPAQPPGSPLATNKKSVVRMETEESRQKRIAEEEKKEKERLAKEEAERKAKEQKEADERRKKEEAERERKRKEEEERKKKQEEEERKKREEEERIAAEKKRKEEEERERIRKEEEEKERLRKEEEERERIRKEEEEAKARAEAEAKAKAEAEAKAKAEAEAKAKADAEAKAKAEAEAAAKAASKEEPEEGEVVESESKKPAKDGLRINTTMPPPNEIPRKRPGPLDLSSTNKMSIPSALPSALATARIIEDIGTIQYPEGVQSPKAELNVGAKDGKFRYDRDFLLQFMSICNEKPDNLPEAIQNSRLENQQDIPFPAMSRGGSGRHRQSSNAQTPNRQNSMGLGINGPFKGSVSGFGPGGMGSFATGGSSKLSSEERFAMSNRSASISGAAPFGRPTPLQRTASQGGGAPMGSNRNRSKRGEKRNDANRLSAAVSQGHGSGFNPTSPASAIGLEPVAPLQTSKNAWVPISTGRKAAPVDQESPEIVDRKVKSLLNKLTMEKFDSISDQIIEWANKSEKEKDGRTLIQVIRLVFEKATDEATWSEMYARLCRKMMERISPQVQDDGIRNPEGKPIAGGQLFRKYLLNRCQEDFERGWQAKEATAAAAATKAAEEKPVDAEKKDENEVELYSDEYYAAQKAKRRGLGLIKFIGELFKLQMLTERIMHECVKKLLGNVENPEEEEIESLCKLLTTVGNILDNNSKARAHMDIYFTRMKDLTQSPNVSSRMQFMLQDVVELRERKWVARNQVAAPTTLAAVHEQAAKEKVAQEKDSHRHVSMSRTGSRRGQDRGEAAQVGPDGWTPVAGGGGSTRAPPKVGDLSQFGKISKGAPMTFGPASVFNKKEGSKRDSIVRTSSSSNMFSMLSANAEPSIPDAIQQSKSSRPPSRKPSVDLTSSIPLPEPAPVRKRLMLQPRTVPTPGDLATPAESRNVSEDEGDEKSTAPAEMSDADAKKKIDEDAKEFFAVRNLDEAEEYFSALPPNHHPKLVEKLVGIAAEGKQDQAQLTADLFARALSKKLTTSDALVEGLGMLAEFIDDLAIDAPAAPKLFALIVNATGLDNEQKAQIASKSMEPDKLSALLMS